MRNRIIQVISVAETGRLWTCNYASTGPDLDKDDAMKHDRPTILLLEDLAAVGYRIVAVKDLPPTEDRSFLLTSFWLQLEIPNT